MVDLPTLIYFIVKLVPCFPRLPPLYAFFLSTMGKEENPASIQARQERRKEVLIAAILRRNPVRNLHRKFFSKKK